MRYQVVKSVIFVVGKIWMPTTGLAAYEYNLRDVDVRNFLKEGPITRDVISDWLDKNAGDFQSITDFKADLSLGKGDWLFDWQTQRNETLFLNLMYGSTDTE